MQELVTTKTMAISGVIENNSYQDLYDSISGDIETNPIEREKYMRMAASLDLISSVQHSNIVAGVDLYRELYNFIHQQNSQITGENYSRWLDKFLEYCKNENIEPLRITRIDVERYVQYLNEKHAPNSVRSMVTTVGSFYSYLMIHHPKLFQQNVFMKLKLPPITLTRRIDIVMIEDIKTLRYEFKRIKRKDFVCLLDIVSKYGLRIGTFQKMSINYNTGHWQSISKGKSLQGNFTKKELKQISISGLLDLRYSTMTNTVIKYTKKLYKAGMISCPYSWHDLRHFFIETSTKNMTIEQFMKFYKGIHKNPATTLGYINSF